SLLPRTLYFTIVMLYDDTFTKIIHPNEIPAYMGPLFNAMALRLKQMIRPEIRLVFQNLRKLEDPMVLAVVDKYYVNANDTLRNLSAHIRTDRYKRYYGQSDIVLLFTTYELVSQEGERGFTGISYYGGVCNSSRKVAVVEDDGRTYRGTGPAVQQIAHLLGAKFDGYGSSKECPVSDSMLMANNRGNTKRVNPSVCSKKQIVWFLSKLNTSTCGQESEVKINRSSVTELLPGRVAQVDTHCNKVFPNVTNIIKCKPDQEGYEKPDQCKIACCEGDTKEAVTYVFAAPDGYPCEDQKKLHKKVISQAGQEHPLDNIKSELSTGEQICVAGSCVIQGMNFVDNP
ncbi:unnamed protein product, partial [Ixodes hexagonus]